jgi:hypothetical protein
MFGKKSAKKPEEKRLAERDKAYADLGKAVANFYENGYLSKKETYKMSFIKGALAGFGGVLGATVLIAMLLWILSLFGNSDIPFLNKITHQVYDTINTQKK